MTRPMPHTEIQDLLGVFALDAVDPAEVVLIESHLVTCPRCRDEVREHREVASLLAYSGTAAPDGMWDRLAATLEDAPVAQAAPVLQLGRRRAGQRPGSRRRTMAVAAAVAAASLVAGVGTVGGIQVQAAFRRQADEIGRQASEIQRLQPLPENEVRARLLQEAAVAALGQGARSVHLLTPDKTQFADAVVLASGSGYLIDRGAPVLPKGQTYQLWAITGGQKLSLGVLGGEVDVVTFSAPAALDALALTVEESPGVAVTQNQAVGYGFVGPPPTLAAQRD